MSTTRPVVDLDTRDLSTLATITRKAALVLRTAADTWTDLTPEENARLKERVEVVHREVNGELERLGLGEGNLILQGDPHRRNAVNNLRRAVWQLEHTLTCDRNPGVDWIDASIGSPANWCEAAARLLGETLRTDTPTCGPRIISDGKGRYRIADSRQLKVSDLEDTLLQACLATPAMDKADLADALGLEGNEAVKVLRGLRDGYGGVFAPAIHFPGKRGQGGYFINIRSA